MKIFNYSVLKINGTLTDKSPLETLEEHLNLQGEDGYRLHSVVPQVSEGNTEANILIFESEDEIMD